MLKQIICLVGLLALGCHQNYEEGAHPDPISPPQAQLPANHSPTEASQGNKPAGEVVVSGTLSIEGSLLARLPKTATLYIIGRPAPVGPPLAIKRIPLPTFPYSYALTQADAGMMPGQEVDMNGLDALYISVKIDQDGMVGPAQPGDMEGAYASNPVAPGSLNVDIVIDKVY